MSEQPHASRETADERVDLSEAFEKSAEVLAFEPSADFEMPMAMGIDYTPESSAVEDEE